MRVDVVLRYIGVVMLFIAMFMLLSAGISYLSGMDSAFYPLLLSSLLTALLGAFPLIFVGKREQITNKEGFCIVVGAWLVACVVSMFPYLIWGGEFSLVNAWFESVSGLTTTGSTILNDVEALPRGLQFWRMSSTWIGGMGVLVLMLALLLLGRGSADKCRGLWVFVLTCAVCGGAFVVYVLQGMCFDFAALLARADLILHDPQYDFTTADRLAMLRSKLSAVIGNCWLSALAGVALAAAGMLFGERRGFARSLEKALWYTAFFLSLWCTAYCLRAQELDFRYMCPAFALAGGWTFWCDRREAGHRPLRRLLFWLGWLPGIAAYLFILRSTLIALPTTFMYLFWPAVCGTAALLLKPRPTRRHRAAAALLAAGLLLACAVPKLCLVLETGWHCEPITAIQPERITRGPAAGTWADTKAADMQECLYEALAPYAGKSVLQAIGEQHGLGFLMADGTLTVAQASVISGTDSDPRFEQYYALLPEKQPDVILYDDAEVRDMAEFHAWIEQHFTITDRYTVQHGTASLQVLVVG